MTLAVTYIPAAALTIYLAPGVVVHVVAVHGIVSAYLSFRP